MKYYIVTMLLWVGAIQAFSQQPRLKQVDEYLAATGQTVELKGAPERRYGLLSTLYNNQKNLMLNLPDLEDYGARGHPFRLSTKYCFGDRIGRSK